MERDNGIERNANIIVMITDKMPVGAFQILSGKPGPECRLLYEGSITELADGLFGVTSILMNPDDIHFILNPYDWENNEDIIFGDEVGK